MPGIRQIKMKIREFTGLLRLQPKPRSFTADFGELLAQRKASLMWASPRFGLSVRSVATVLLMLGGWTQSPTAFAQATVAPTFESGTTGPTGSVIFDYPYSGTGVNDLKVTFTVNSTGYNHYSVRATGYPGGAAFGAQRLDSLSAPTTAMYTNATTSTPAVLLDAYGTLDDCPRTANASTAATCFRGTMTVVFSQPVTNPELHFTGLGNNSVGGLRFNPVYALTGSLPAGASATRLSGNPPFAINTPPPATATVSSSTPMNTVDVSCVDNVASCGSVRINGTHITQLTFNVFLRYSATSDWALVNAPINTSNYDGHLVIATVPPQARVRVAKISNGGTDSFSFSSMTNLSNTTDAVTTTVDGTSVTSAQTNLVLRHNQSVSITEATSAAYVLTGVTCVDANRASTGNPVTLATTLTGQQVTILASAIRTGADITCTFTNARRPIVRLQKQLPLGRFAATDQFSLAIAGPGGPASVATTGSGTTATGTAVINIATAGSPYSFSETASAGADLNNYTTTYNCSNAYASGTSVPAGSGAAFSVTPQLRDDLTCTFVNSRDPLADLAITKTNLSDGANPLIVGATTTYRLTITNNGPDAVTGAVVTDAPQSGLNCPTTNAVTCSGPACTGATPASPTLAALLSGGITLGTQPTGAANATTLTFACQVL